MYAHGEADDVNRFLDVRFPVASLLGIIDALDKDIVVFFAVGVHTKGREPYLAGVLCSGKEIDYTLLLLVDAFEPFLLVGNTFRAEDTLPIALVDLYLVLDRGSVLKLRFLGGGDELLNIIPARIEDSGVIRYRIISIARGRYARDDGELTFLGAALEAGLEIGPGIVDVEQRDVLHIGRSGRVLPVGKEYFLACAVCTSRSEAAITSLLAEHGGNTRAVLGEDDERDTEAEVFEIKASA